jgi:site-specific DNA recombinase
VLSLFDPVWESLTPTEQARVVQLLVERVDYDGARGRVSITFHETGIRTLADEIAQKNTMEKHA